MQSPPFAGTYRRCAGRRESPLSRLTGWPHQANMRIIEAAAHKLKFPMERCLTGIEQMGNVSAACIPIVLDRANCEGRFRKGDLLALTAFGAGLTTGACILKW